MADAKAAQAERVRDLTGQLKGIGQQEMPEILFQEISPGREPVTIYSVEDGRPVPVPAYMLGAVMTKTLEDGRFMFVSDAKDAPEYKLGTVKCFLNPDSPMREMVEAVGLGAITCRKATLASEHSRRIHGQHRHKQEWAAVKEYIEDQKEAKRETRQDKQLEATLSIARGGSATQDVTDVKVYGTPERTCDICGKTGFKRIKAHKSMAHK
jgi:hypothetical protein